MVEYGIEYPISDRSNYTTLIKFDQSEIIMGGHATLESLVRVTSRIKRKTLKNPALSSWSVRDMRDLAQEAVVLIDTRAFDKCLGLNDKPHPTYEQLTGKQGKGAYSKHWGEVRAGNRKPPKQYGTTKPKAGRNLNKVDLQYSDRMRQSFRFARATRFTVLVGVFGDAAMRAHGTHALRPWLGLSPKDRKSFIKRALDMIKGAR